MLWPVSVGLAYRLTNILTAAKYSQWKPASKVILHFCQYYTYYKIGVVIKSARSTLYVLSIPLL